MAGAIFCKTKQHQGELVEELIEDSARDYLNKRKYREAISLFKLNNFIFPDSGTTYRNLADAYMKNGDDGLAKELRIQGMMVEQNIRNSANMPKQLDARHTPK